jgi:hypothetical protein
MVLARRLGARRPALARRRRSSIERNRRSKRTIARSGLDVVRSGQSRGRREYPDLTAPLEIAGEIGNYVKLDTDFS